MSGDSDKHKQQQHLSLLKEEYVKLQAYCNELEKKHATLAATYGDCNDKSFVSRLLKTVTTLYNNTLYRYHLTFIYLNKLILNVLPMYVLYIKIIPKYIFLVT